MTGERVWTAPLLVFLAAVAGVGVLALLRARLPADPEAVVTRLVDGDLERDERQRLLRHLLGLDAAAAERPRQLDALLAAIALDDAEAFARARARLGGSGLPLAAADVGHVDGRAFGDPVLHNLLAGWLAEAAGDRTAARRSYDQVGAQTHLFAMPLAQRCAAEGLARLP